MSKINKMHRYWASWEPKLRQIVDLKGAKLIFPLALRTAGETKTTIELAPQRPICIHNAPDKASSTKKNGNQVIIIDGMFEVYKGDPDPFLHYSSCNVSIFRSFEVPRQSANLELIDAIHFDLEFPPDSAECRLFHPIFHAQRGRSLTDEVCRSLAAEAFKLQETQITVDQSKSEVLGTPYVRLPTPPLDLFSVMTMVAADFFCNPGEGVAKKQGRAKSQKPPPAAAIPATAKDKFVSMLELLRHKDNVVCTGASSQSLRTRLNGANHLSAGYWYPECV